MSLLYWLQDFLIAFFCSFNMIRVGILPCIILFSFGYREGSIYVVQCSLNCWISGLTLSTSLKNFGYSFFRYFFCLFMLSFPLRFHWHVCQPILYQSIVLRMPCFFPVLFFLCVPIWLISIDLPSSFLVSSLNYVKSTDQSIWSLIFLLMSSTFAWLFLVISFSPLSFSLWFCIVHLFH